MYAKTMLLLAIVAGLVMSGTGQAEWEIKAVPGGSSHWGDGEVGPEPASQYDFKSEVDFHDTLGGSHAEVDIRAKKDGQREYQVYVVPPYGASQGYYETRIEDVQEETGGWAGSKSEQHTKWTWIEEDCIERTLQRIRTKPEAEIKFYADVDNGKVGDGVATMEAYAQADILYNGSSAVKGEVSECRAVTENQSLQTLTAGAGLSLDSKGVVTVSGSISATWNFQSNVFTRWVQDKPSWNKNTTTDYNLNWVDKSAAIAVGDKDATKVKAEASSNADASF